MSADGQVRRGCYESDGEGEKAVDRFLSDI